MPYKKKYAVYLKYKRFICLRFLIFFIICVLAFTAILCYFQYHEELPLKILLLIYFVLALPVIGWIITISLFLLGIYSIWKYVRRRSTGKKKDFIEEELKKSSLELEAFIPIPS